LWQRFENLHSGRVVFVLDEVDLISEKDKHKDILYLISRSTKNYMAVLLSNNPKFLSPLDESIKSTLQPEIVHFRNYDATEIEQILLERAKVGLKVVPEAIPSQIAAMTAKNTNSDVRVAIKTLYLWAVEPQTGLHEHFEKARRDIVFDMIRDLNDRNLLVLKAVLDQSEGFAKDVYQTYRRISAAVHEEPFSYMHFYSNLSYLQSLGLVVLISTKVQRTYANRIQLTFDPSILTTIWTMRFA
jgi:cell division control protein 6